MFAGFSVVDSLDLGTRKPRRTLCFSSPLLSSAPVHDARYPPSFPSLTLALPCVIAIPLRYSGTHVFFFICTIAYPSSSLHPSYFRSRSSPSPNVPIQETRTERHCSDCTLHHNPSSRKKAVSCSIAPPLLRLAVTTWSISELLPALVTVRYLWSTPVVWSRFTAVEYGMLRAYCTAEEFHPCGKSRFYVHAFGYSREKGRPME
ncbi:hypothetical protein Mapa_008721 [Marchantia paleacea]|nr:hypothetical protein Mapa_008721 [Marchantia paleacea]